MLDDAFGALLRPASRTRDTDTAHARRSFRYAVYMAAIDLDEPLRARSHAPAVPRIAARICSRSATATTRRRWPTPAHRHGDHDGSAHRARGAARSQRAARHRTPTSARHEPPRSSATSSTPSASSSTTTPAVRSRPSSPRSTTPYGGGFRYVLGPSARVARPARELFATSASCSSRRSCPDPRATTSRSTHHSTARRSRSTCACATPPDRSVFTASFTGERDGARRSGPRDACRGAVSDDDHRTRDRAHPLASADSCDSPGFHIRNQAKITDR